MSRKARGFRNTLRLESLERREVFAADLVLHPVVPQPEPFAIASSLSATQVPQTPQARLAAYVQTKLWQINTSPELSKPDSQSALDDKIGQLVTKYWEGVFDKPVSEVGSQGFGFFSDLVLRGEMPEPALSLAPLSMPITYSIDTLIRDHADMVGLTSDGYLYVSLNENIAVVDLNDPASMSSSLTSVASNDYAARLIVSGNRLVRISQRTDAISIYGTESFSYIGRTNVEIFDITNRTSPQKLSSFTFDGHQAMSQLRAGRLTLVTNSASSIVLPQVAVVQGTDGVSRFESASSYLARNRDALLGAIIPDYKTGNSATPQDIGSWDDLVIATDLLASQVSVIELDIDAPTPKIVDSEIVLGATSQGVYSVGDTLYLYSQIYSPLSQISAYGSVSVVALPNVHYVTGTALYKFSTSSSDVEALDSIVLPIDIQDTRMMNEHEGVLRVAGNYKGEAAIYTVGDKDSDWVVLGELKKIATEQMLLSVAFDGDHALITTGNNVPTSGFFGDPLHGIDLSDPAAPRETGEVDLPGFNTYLQKIDDTHWLGLGYKTNESNFWRNSLQVAIFSTADWASPRVVDTWTGDASLFGPWGSLNDSNTNYDPQTNLLTLSSTFGGAGGVIDINRVLAFKIDLASDDPLKLVPSIKYPELVMRTLVYNDHLYAISYGTVIAQSVSDLNAAVGQVYLTEPTELKLYRTYSTGQTDTFYLLAGWDPSTHVVQSIEAAEGLTATLGTDGQLTVKVAEKVNSQTNEIVVRYKTNGGPVQTLRVVVTVNNLTPPPAFSQSQAKILARFEDDAGQEVTDLKSGDKAWVVLSGQDLRTNGSGLFAAYFQVSFESTNVTIIGEPEFLNDFTNGRQKVASANGYTSLGAFGDATLDSTEPQDVVRFRIQLNSDSPVSIVVAPAHGVGREFLVYGDSYALNPENIQPITLSTSARSEPSGEADTRQDFNGDGIVSGLDVLQIVNFINNRAVPAQSTFSAQAASTSTLLQTFDLTGDGDVTGLDVLQIVNAINLRGTGFSASGEGEAAVQAVDLALGDFGSDGWLKRSRR